MLEKIPLIAAAVIVVVIVEAVIRGAIMTSQEVDACRKRGGVPVQTRAGTLCLKQEAINESKP